MLNEYYESTTSKQIFISSNKVLTSSTVSVIKQHHWAPSSSGLGHWPLTPVTGVRVPLGSPSKFKHLRIIRKCFFVFLFSMMVNSKNSVATIKINRINGHLMIGGTGEVDTNEGEIFLANDYTIPI